MWRAAFDLILRRFANDRYRVFHIPLSYARIIFLTSRIVQRYSYTSDETYEVDGKHSERSS